MNAFPTTFTAETEWVEIDNLPEDIKPALEMLESNGFRIQLGMQETDVAQLSEIVQQPSIREFCPNDATKRFKDVPTTEAWFTKGRLMFLLKEPMTDTIAGYGWFGPGTNERVPGANLTGALRLNEQYQGKGLATPFLAVMLAYTRAFWPDETMWFETWQSNTGAVHIYQKVGFETVDQHADTRPTAEGGTIEDTRLFMKSLP